MTKRIIVNENGENSYLYEKTRSRLYCGYGLNTNETSSLQGVWERFPYPSTGMDVYRNRDFSVDPAMTRFTYQGTEAKWFDITATCNVKKGSGGTATRTIAFQWYLNGSPIGTSREFQMNSESNIITGNGEIYLSQGDYIEPFIANVENSDKALMWNCSFNIREDYDVSYRS